MNPVIKLDSKFAPYEPMHSLDYSTEHSQLRFRLRIKLDGREHYFETYLTISDQYRLTRQFCDYLDEVWKQIQVLDFKEIGAGI